MRGNFGRSRLLALLVSAALAAGCQQAAEAPAPPPPSADALAPAPDADAAARGPRADSWSPGPGDLDGMVERRVIRVLTVQSPVLYFVDKGREVGITYEATKAFEKQLNQKLGNTIVTRARDPDARAARRADAPAARRGEGDIAAAQLTDHAGAPEAGGLLGAVRDAASPRCSSPAREPRRWRASTSSPARRSTSGSRAATPSTCGR